MTSPAKMEISEQYMQIARRWFTAGWTEIMTFQDQFAIMKQIGYLPGQRLRRLTAGRACLAEGGTSWICT